MNNNNHENYVLNNENDVEDWWLGWGRMLFEDSDEDAADHEDGDNNNHENYIQNNENDVDLWD